jgi:hypothetical protein
MEVWNDVVGHEIYLGIYRAEVESGFVRGFGFISERGNLLPPVYAVCQRFNADNGGFATENDELMRGRRGQLHTLFVAAESPSFGGPSFGARLPSGEIFAAKSP